MHVQAASRGWWIREQKKPEIQAFVGKSFKRLPHSVALFLDLEKVEGQYWLGALDGYETLMSGEVKRGVTRTAALAFTYRGLLISGLDEGAAEQFDRPFQDGMTEKHRARRLGDVHPAWCADRKVRPWVWSGDADTAKKQVHALLLLYAACADDLATWRASVKSALADRGCRVTHKVELGMIVDDRGRMREHFGFVDGISQPLPLDNYWEERDKRESRIRVGDPGAIADGGEAFKHDDPPGPEDEAWKYHGIPTGDVLFGRWDSFRELPPSPFIAQPDDTPDDEKLAEGVAPQGFGDFGFDGSYLVVRQLKQDVAGFWNDVRELAEPMGLAPHELAERMMGRTLDGTMLTPPPDRLSDTAFDAPSEGFAKTDPHGFGCPFGSHVRRANPRDDGADDTRAPNQLLDSTNNHRVLRRGRIYGDKISDQFEDDGRDRGLLFMCLNTDIARQFEFIQETWLLSRRFSQLGETDPILGPAGIFTFQDIPVRRKIDFRPYVQAVGGEYFFLPGIRALNYLRARQKAGF